MLIHVDPSNGLAIYDQISRQIKFAVAHGAIREGDLIPSVRELAQRVAVNPNTVARAYRDLQADGVLEPLRGEGLRVAKRAAEACRQERWALLTQRLRSVIAECRGSGLDPTEIRRLIDDVLAESGTQETG